MHYPKKISLKRDLFQKLLDAVLLKISEEYGLKRVEVKKSMFFGMDDYAPDKQPDLASVASIIAKHENVAAFLRSLPDSELKGVNFGAALYKKEQDLKNGLSVIPLQGRAYTTAYFKFLGCNTLADFETMQPAPHTAEEQRDTARSAAPPQEEWTYYIGAYYSFVSYRIKKFLLAIDYKNKTPQGMKAWVWGFHNNETLHGDLTDPLNTLRMTGHAEVTSSHLYIRLKGDPDDVHGRDIGMHIIGLCDARGGFGLEKQEIIMSSVQTVSLRYYLVNVEAVLVRTTADYAIHFVTDKEEYLNSCIAPDLSDDENKALHLYLMLERKNFRVKYPPVTTLDDLRVKGALVSKYTERLRGTWRIWNFGLQRGKVLQSRLEVGTENGIERPYAAYFYPFIKKQVLETYRGQRDPREQVVALSVSNEIALDQLCFATYIKSHLNLANYAIFDLRTIETLGYAEGMFVSSGYDKHGIIGGYAVMVRETEGRPVEVKEMNRLEAEREAELLGLEKLLLGLRDLWKRKLWKKRQAPSSHDDREDGQQLFSDWS
ncbi:MAG: hypothetical protein U0U46_07015 [Saprospiraceae bacterium]